MWRPHLSPPWGSSSRLRLPATGYAVAFLAIAAATFVLTFLRIQLGLLNVGLVYLLVVVVIAAGWGWGPGLVASVVANLALNFFFIPPLYRFAVQAPENVFALAIFLGVAALTGALLARAQSGEAAAQRREQETALLYDLSNLIIRAVDLTAALTTICNQVRTTFSAESVAVLLVGGGTPDIVAQAGAVDAGASSVDEQRAAKQAMSTGTVVALGGRPGRRTPKIIGITGRHAPVVYVPLQVGSRVLGVLRVVGRLHAQFMTDDELRLLHAFGDEAALAADRYRLIQEATQVEAMTEADQLKSALLAAVSHDLRTPLAAIKASASSLLQSDVSWDEATRREFLLAIDEETDRLTNVVSNLLDLSRIEGGALRPDKDWYDIREMVETVSGRMGKSVSHHQLLIDLPADIGEASFDYVQIGQVLTNLIDNAAKFSPAGTVIRVAAQRVGDEVEFSVSDQGPGVPPAQRERVFDKFYRLKQGGTPVPGTGLGLAISKGLVEAHGGRTYVTDAPGGGARFVFTLPLPSAAASATHQEIV